MCLLKHRWIYSIDSSCEELDGSIHYYSDGRKCLKCGKRQFILCTFDRNTEITDILYRGFLYYWVREWFKDRGRDILGLCKGFTIKTLKRIGKFLIDITETPIKKT